MDDEGIDITPTHIVFHRTKGRGKRKKKVIDIWNLEELTGDAQTKRINDFSDVKTKLGPRSIEQLYIQILSFMNKPVENEYDRYEFFKSLHLINHCHINRRILNFLEAQKLIWEDMNWGDWDESWNERTRWQITDNGVELLRFLESGGKLSDLCFVYIQGDQYVFARTPIMFKKDNQVQLIYGARKERLTDNIIMIGKVVEALDKPIEG